MTEDPPRLTVKHTLPHAHDAAWAVLRDIRAWYWPDKFHGLPTNWAHRRDDAGVTVSGAGTWTHAYLPIFPWAAEPVGFRLDVDDVMHALTIAEVPADPRNRKREHTQRWSVTPTSPHTCVLTVELWHAPTPLIGWYAHPLLSRSAKVKMKRVEDLTVTRADLRGEHRPLLDAERENTALHMEVKRLREINVVIVLRSNGLEFAAAQERAAVVDYLTWRAKTTHYNDAAREFVNAAQEVSDGVHHTINYEEELP